MGRLSVESRPILSLGHSPHFGVRHPFISGIVCCTR